MIKKYSRTHPNITCRYYQNYINKKHFFSFDCNKMTLYHLLGVPIATGSALLQAEKTKDSCKKKKEEIFCLNSLSQP